MSDNKDDLSITLHGSKVPATIMIAGFAALITSIIYGTVWLTKLDDRVMDNNEHIAELHQIAEDHEEAMRAIQANCHTQGAILGDMVDVVKEIKGIK
ncbi:hypothetical protein OAG36_01130 [bacterium]|nr:hypothetical protein [bacterium]